MTTSCEGPGLLSEKNIKELNTEGATRYTPIFFPFCTKDCRAHAKQSAKKELGNQCVHVCKSTEITANSQLCEGEQPTSCHTDMSCGSEECACWINIECEGKQFHAGGGEQEQLVHSDGGKVDSWTSGLNQRELFYN